MMMMVSSWLRRKVSKKKIRYDADGYDLDLTYICDNVIAMGYPSVGVESLYRNRLVDVQRFLDARHPAHYKVYNLCSERRKQYTTECFDNRTAWYPFDDHNVPPFEMLCELMKDMEEYLGQDDDNVAVIHCKAGKGRTGLVVASHLLHSGQYATSSESLHHFGSRRTHNSKGVTIPSQLRWVAMYERHLLLMAAGSGLPSPTIRMRLDRIVISHGGPKFDCIVVTCGEHTWSSNVWGSDWRMKKGREEGISKSITIVPPEEIHLLLSHDCHIAFIKLSRVLGKKRRVFGCWFNMQFINDDTLKLGGQELDGIVKRKQNFAIEISFVS